ncbi:netrin receptor DCC-like isoform X2 [Hydractinia symbiolongicarpus]|uniref:netrin receptor DCC-like isoform X2 n=1 Tax=Hydractinia symbiolongicarpus TaxID=13093 RepID=UPI00254C569A|nr:netrin receptor DCC-like isoform X2 [Hydractinia symbiolongicarpus]
MTTKSECSLYGFFFLTGCLSIFDYIRYKDSSGQGTFANTAINEDLYLRSRRDIDAIGAPFNLEKLLAVIKRYENVDSIDEALRNVIQKTILKLREEHIRNVAKKCNCTSQPGPMGPSGPPGPPGKGGKKGFGLLTPKLTDVQIYPVANESDDKILKCQFLGNPIPSVRWEHHFANINITMEIDPHESIISSYLHVRNITWNDHRSNLTCTAQNIIGIANASGSLTVHIPPIIHLPSDRIYANLGTNFKFPECKVTSNPPATITWKRGYGNLPFGRHEKNGTSLEIFNVREEDTGYYVCEAENYLGKSNLGIQLKPRPLQFVEKPLSSIKSVALQVIRCSALGTPENMYGKIVNLDKGMKLPVEESTNGTLFTLKAYIARPGNYKCIIWDLTQSVESSFRVKFSKLPSVLLTKKHSKSLKVWLKEESAFGQYVLCFDGKRDNWNTTKFHKRCDNKPHTVTILRTKHKKTFGAYSDIPWSPSSTSRTSSKAFVFSFYLGKRKLLIKSGSQAVCYSSSNGPCFGQHEVKVGNFLFLYNYEHQNEVKNRFRTSLGKSFPYGYVPTSDFLDNMQVFYRQKF